MFDSCLAKQNEIKALFQACINQEQKYQQIIQLGKQLAPLEENYKTPENQVQGCQSVMHLHSWLEDQKVFFAASSDALISAGLAAILIKVYSGESPETILKCPPDYLTDLGINASLTPSRANGLFSIHLKMKQEALKWLILLSKK